MERKLETELLRKQVDGKVEFTSFESKEMNLKIELENLAAGNIDIALTPLRWFCKLRIKLFKRQPMKF